MKIFAKCTGCKEHVILSTKASTRPELAHEKGENIKINCTHCGKDFSRHVNEIRAKVNYTTILIGVAVGTVLTIVSIFFIGFIALATFMIPLIIWQSQEKNVHAFNKYLI